MSQVSPATRARATRSWIAGLFLVPALVLGMAGCSGESATTPLARIADKGTPYADLTDAIFDADPDTAGVQELKLWQALVEYGRGLPALNSDGLPDLPDGYLTPAGRIVGLDG